MVGDDLINCIAFIHVPAAEASHDVVRRIKLGNRSEAGRRRAICAPISRSPFHRFACFVHRSHTGSHRRLALRLASDFRKRHMCTWSCLCLKFRLQVSVQAVNVLCTSIRHHSILSVVCATVDRSRCCVTYSVAVCAMMLRFKISLVSLRPSQFAASHIYLHISNSAVQNQSLSSKGFSPSLKTWI